MKEISLNSHFSELVRVYDSPIFGIKDPVKIEKGRVTFTNSYGFESDQPSAFFPGSIGFHHPHNAMYNSTFGGSYVNR